MERRTFIKNAAVIGAGMAAAVPATASPKTLPVKAGSIPSVNGRINLALIGARNQGGRVHLPSVVNHPDLHLSAICDVDQGVLQSALDKAKSLLAEEGKPFEIKGYRDFRELLLRDDVDAVLIATPDHWHVPMATAAIRAGKDVYVEKPLSLYMEEGRDLANLLKEHPQIVQVGSQQRSGDRFLIASEAVRQGLLGDVHRIDVEIQTRQGKADMWEAQPVPAELDYDLWLGPVTWTDYHPDRVHYNFRFVPEFSGGDITNWGAHHLDIVQQALGMDESGPVFINGRGRRNPAGSVHTPYYGIDVDIRYANGVAVKLRSSSEKSGIRFFGSAGSLFVSRDELVSNPPELLRSFPRGLGASLRKTKGSHLTNWIECMKSRRADNLHAPVEIGHRSATVCHLANIAIELRRPLHWDPEREVFLSDAHANALLNRPVRKGWET